MRGGSPNKDNTGLRRPSRFDSMGSRVGISVSRPSMNDMTLGIVTDVGGILGKSLRRADSNGPRLIAG